MAVDSTETTGRFPQFCCWFPINSACRELVSPSHNELVSVLITCGVSFLEPVPWEGLCDMLKDFQESLCQSREPLSILRVFLRFFPLVEKASHWCFSKEPFANTMFAGAAIHTSISRVMPAPGVTRDAWGVTKVPALCNRRQISSPVPRGMTLHGNRQPGLQETQRPSQNCTEPHLIFIYNFFCKSTESKPYALIW